MKNKIVTALLCSTVLTFSSVTAFAAPGGQQMPGQGQTAQQTPGIQPGGQQGGQQIQNGQPQMPNQQGNPGSTTPGQNNTAPQGQVNQNGSAPQGQMNQNNTAPQGQADQNVSGNINQNSGVQPEQLRTDANTQDQNMMGGITGKVTVTITSGSGYPEYTILIRDNDGNYVPVDGYGLEMVDKPEELHSLSITKEFDDNGTGAVLNENIRYGMLVNITNLPLKYMHVGLEANGALIYPGNFFSNGKWMSGANAAYAATMEHMDPVTLGTTYFHVGRSGNDVECSFVVFLDEGETFKLDGLPDGAVYTISECSLSGVLKNVPFSDYQCIFEWPVYENEAGTISGEDVSATVKNTLKTIDIKIKKTIYGYDNGAVFYIGGSLFNDTNIKSFEMSYETSAGSGSITIESTPYDNSKFLIPFRPEDGEIIVKIPAGMHYAGDFGEFIVSLDAEDLSYEELLELFRENSYEFFYSAGTFIKSGYVQDGNMPSSDSNRTNDFFMWKSNYSRMVAFDKVNAAGNSVEGALMQVIEKDSGEVVQEWTTDGEPHVWNLVKRDGSSYSENNDVYGKTYILHEESAPEGYKTAEDVEFVIRKHEGTATTYRTYQSSSNEPITQEESYFYPYMDTGDGEETLVLEMEDAFVYHDVVISKTDINGNEIGGAQLRITGRESGSAEDIQPVTWVSEEGASKTVSLKPGEYTLHEDAVPDTQVYVLASDITFTVDVDGKVKIDGKDVGKATMVDLYVAHDITVSKTVAGNMGDKSRDFSFTLKLTEGGYGGLPEEVSYEKGSETGTLTLDDGQATFTLAHGETITFKDIPYGTSYEVAESAEGSAGYNVTMTNESGTIGTEDVEVSFVNTRNASVPTNATWPVWYFLPLCAVAVGLLVLLKRRQGS